MRIKRSSRYPLSKSLKLIAQVNETVGNPNGFELNSLRGTIHTADTEYAIDGLDDLMYLQNLGIINIRLVYVELDYKHLTNEELITLKLTHSTSDEYVDIECSGKDVDTVESLFALLKKNIFINGYYKYNATNENLQKQKDTRKYLIDILESLDDLQVRSLAEIKNEKDFQNFLYPVLRSHFDDLEDEHYLPKYGTKTYQPDFGIPSAKLLIEAKFLKSKSDLKRRQSEIHDDVIGYLGSSDKYKKIIVVIYNYGSVAINKTEIDQMEKVRGIERIIVCKHVIPNNIKG